ncbi:hypothetical protein Q6886_001613 [Staphylococcus pseudintermedius]|nr:hypothetical protein [Staphylococcus pseudintermedius]
MKKIVLSFSIILLSIILTGCVDKEIKELNGEWESYDGNKLKLIIKNDSMNMTIIQPKRRQKKTS